MKSSDAHTRHGTRTAKHTDPPHQWVDLGPIADFPESGEHVCLTAAGRSLVVFHFDGAVRVISNVCPHAGLPIGEGERRGAVITCPFHGYTYHLKNGRNVDWPHDEPPLKMYPARIDGGRVLVQLQQPPDRKQRKDEKRDEPDRGPAPADTPPDEQPPCDPQAPDSDDPHDPDCPDGYPDEQREG